MAFIPTDIPISKIILDNTFNGIFSETQLEQSSLPLIDLEKSIENVKERLRVKLISGICSSVLANQIARHRLQFIESFAGQIHQYHFQAILDAIESAESGSSIKIGPFKWEPLKGLEHIHHNSNTFVAQNMLNCWKQKFGSKDEIRFQNELLKDIFVELMKEYPSDIANPKAITILLTQLLNESKFRPQKRQTGEWIVFGKIEGINYYLCLATHKETNDTIFERLKPCFDEFPLLAKILDMTNGIATAANKS